jgi:WD40 repeat protein
MKKVTSRIRFPYIFVILFVIAVLGLRSVYIKKYGYSQPWSNTFATRPKVNFQTKAEIVVFDASNNLCIIKKQTDAGFRAIDSISSDEDIALYYNIKGEKSFTSYSIPISKIQIQNTYFPENRIDYGTPTNRIAFSEEGNLLIGANGMQVGIYDIVAKKWFFKTEIQGGMEYHPLGFLNAKTALVLLSSLSPTIKQQPLVCFLDIQTGKIVRKKEIPLPKNTMIDSVKWSESQKQILITTSTLTQSMRNANTFVISAPYQTFIFDGESLNQVKTSMIPQPSKQILPSQDGTRVLLSIFGGSNLGYVWNVSANTLEEIPTRKRQSSFDEHVLAFSPNGKRVAVDGDRGIGVWNTETKSWEINLEDVSTMPFNFLMHTCSNNGLIHPMFGSEYFYKMQTSY